MSLNKLSKAIGPRVTIEGSMPDAPWVSEATEEEIARYLVIDGRLERSMATTRDMLAERKRIMRRCIRRMRRTQGKN